MAPTPSFASLQYGLPYSIWQAIMSEGVIPDVGARAGPVLLAAR